MKAILSISGDRVTENCENIVGLMFQLGINGDVTRNTTVLDGRIEKGCRVHIVSEPVKKNSRILWEAAQQKLGLRCAHLEMRHCESGCTYDLFRMSSCPGKE